MSPSFQAPGMITCSYSTSDEAFLDPTPSAVRKSSSVFTKNICSSGSGAKADKARHALGARYNLQNDQYIREEQSRMELEIRVQHKE